MEYKIIQGNRKNYSMTVSEDGKLIVKTPYFYSKKIIEKFIKDKEKWISNQISKISNQRKNSIKIIKGEKLPYLGVLYPLVIEERYSEKVLFQNAFYIGDLNRISIKKAFIKFYKMKARDLLEIKLMTWSNNININYKKFRLSSAKTRWGSCSSNGTISLNFKLIMMSPEIIDYVIVHELCHIVHPNHSKSFWELVQSYIPDYRRIRKMLKELGNIYNFLDK